MVAEVVGGRELAMRRAGIALGSALAAGVLLGGLSRALMRLVAVAAGHDGEFTWAGSFGIVVVFSVAMVPGSLFAVLYRGRRRWLGVAAGAALLCVPAAGVGSDELSGGLSATQWVGVVPATLGVVGCIAALPLLTLWLVDRLAPQAVPSAPVRAPAS